MDTSKNAVKTAVESLKRTEYRFVFALVQGTETHDALMTEAFHQGVAGNGKHHWLYGDSFLGTLDDRKFEKDSPLQKAYSGVVSSLQVANCRHFVVILIKSPTFLPI